MQEFNIALTTINFLILALSLVYKKLKKFYLSEPMIAIAAGIVMGPYIFQLLGKDLNEGEK
jgi:sodium/hydrogen antiporter